MTSIYQYLNISILIIIIIWLVATLLPELPLLPPGLINLPMGLNFEVMDVTVLRARVPALRNRRARKLSPEKKELNAC